MSIKPLRLVQLVVILSLASFCLVVPGLVHGQVGAWTWNAVIPSGASVIEYTSGGMTISNGPGTGSMFLGRTFGAPAAGASRNGIAAVVTENLRVPLGGNNLTIAAKRLLPWAAVAAGAAQAFKAGFDAGAPISRAMGRDSVFIGDVRCVAGDFGWQCDDGDPPNEVQGYKCGTSAEPQYQREGPSPGTACMSYFEDYAQRTKPADSSMWSYSVSMGPVSCNEPAAQCSGSWTLTAVRSTDGFTSNTPQGITAPFYTSTVQQCPAVVDALNPAYSKPAGSNVPGADGKCPSGRYSGRTAEEVGQLLKDFGRFEEAPALAEDILDKGQPIVGAEPGEITGPGSITGQPSTTTTTAPDGTVTTRTSTPTTSYTYSPQGAIYNVTTTTVTQSCLNGSCNTTTETDAPAPPEPSEDCKANPKQAGCQELGDPPTDAPQWTERTVDYAPESVGPAGSCPPPQTIEMSFGTLSWSYQAACDVAPLIRAAWLVLAALAAIAIIARGEDA